MTKPKDIINYHFSESDLLFFDTNIWLFLYGRSNPSDKRPAVYSKALSDAILAKSRILIDVLVMSEFINRFARIEYDISFPKNTNRPDYKNYRNSPAFIPVSQTIMIALRKVMALTLPIESGFSKIKLDDLFSEFETGGYDFNDQILVNLCQCNGLMLVTHDFDFRGANVPILTGNQHLIASHP